MAKQTWQQWVRAIERAPNSQSLIPRGTLAALTGQDAQVMSAIVACWELYAVSDSAGQRAALSAVRSLLNGAQESVRLLARELIPFVLDWSDRERLWPLVKPLRDPPPGLGIGERR